MKTLILVLLLVTSSAFADEWEIVGIKIHHDEWTTADTVRHSFLLGLNFIDYKQTTYGSHHPDKYYETDPLLYRNYTPNGVKRNFERGVLLETAGAYLLPKDWRSALQYITIGGELYAVRQGRLIGVHFSW